MGEAACPTARQASVSRNATSCPVLTLMEPCFSGNTAFPSRSVVQHDAIAAFFGRRIIVGSCAAICRLSGYASRIPLTRPAHLASTGILVVECAASRGARSRAFVTVIS